MHRKFTPAERRLLRAAADYHQLSEIALIVLREMATHGRPIVMISGPMSTGGLGSFKANMKNFRKAVEQAKRRGVFVFDQMPFQDAMIRISRFVEGAKYDKNILHVFYRTLLRSGLVNEVLFLEDWSSSKGARFERKECLAVGVPVEKYPMHWLSPKSTIKPVQFSVEQVKALCGGRLRLCGNEFGWEAVDHFILEDGVLQPYGEDSGDESEDNILPGPGIRLVRLTDCT